MEVFTVLINVENDHLYCIETSLLGIYKTEELALSAAKKALTSEFMSDEINRFKEKPPTIEVIEEEGYKAVRCTELGDSYELRITRDEIQA